MASENQHPFSAAVGCSQQVQVGEEITCHFDITNQETVDYYLPKWQTPLEGMMAQYLSVSKDGQPLPPPTHLLWQDVQTGKTTSW